MESWKVVYLLIIFAGLSIGWKLGPLVGLSVIVLVLIVTEMVSLRKSRSRVRRK